MPYCLIVGRDGKSPLIKGPYNQFTAERKKEELEENSLGEKVDISLEEVSSWDLERAQQELKERRMGELGVTEGSRNFSHGGRS